jgi:AMP-activated protein kinase-like protein
MTLDPRIHQVLDGELPLDALPPEQQVVVRRLLAAGAALRAEVPSPETEPLDARVLASLRRPMGLRVRQWLARPRMISVRLRPAWGLAAAAVLAVVILARTGGPQGSPGAGVVEFVAPFPGARSVAVAGSFNDWVPERLRLSDGDHDGVWRGTAVVPTGAHEYMFVVDGERWIPDPLAARYVEDGYGRQNTLLLVQ